MQNGSPMAINMGQRRLNVQAQDGYKKVSNIEAEELRTIVNRMQTDGDGTNIGELKGFLTKLAAKAAPNLETSTPAKPKLGKGAAVGLAGFALPTMLLQFHSLGWMGNGPVFWLMCILGGLTQIIAGLQEFGNGHNFAYSEFTVYGAYWACMGLLMMGNSIKFFPTSERDMGFFLLVFSIYTFIMFIGSSRLSTVLFCMYFLLFMGYILSAAKNFTGSRILGIIGSCELIACAIVALYIMAHLIYEDVFKRDILPVGPPINEVLRNVFRGKKE